MPVDPRTIPTFTTRLWSEEVGVAEANDAPEAAVGYRFSSGRRFVPTPYDAAAAPTVDAAVGTGQAQCASAAAAVVPDALAVTVATGQGQRSVAAAAATDAAAALAVAVTTGQGQRSAASASVAVDGVEGATLFVSPSGLDSNSGSAAAPLLTIQRAVTLATAGDVVSIAAGTYAETVFGTNDGTALDPIRFVAATRWGVRLVPPAANGSRVFGFEHRGDYVEIDGFEVDGSTDPVSGAVWHVGIGVSGTGAQVAHCHVHHIYRNSAATANGGSGILLDGIHGGSSMAALANCTHHVGPSAGSNAYHGLYITSTGMAKNNISYANTGGGIHCWHDVSNVVIAHNTVFANLTWGIVYGGGDYRTGSGPCDNITVANNIVYANAVGIRELGDLGTNNVITYNNCTGNSTNYSLVVTTRSHDVLGNPAFVDYQADGSGDYAPASGSPAVGAALATHAPADDFAGTTRTAPHDLGAYCHAP